jgi:hypothetical protein
MVIKQTSLDLNGPVLSFIQQPQSVAVNNNATTTFVGIATATFPSQDPSNTPSNTGTLSYRWYAEGFGPLADGSFRGSTLSGTASTTLTVSNAVSPDTNQTNFFLAVDYVSSAYSQPTGSTVTVGTARSTGNAINELLTSNQVTLTVNPFITITSQPQNDTTAIGGRANFSVNATLSDGRFGGLSYQWQINGQNLTDDGNLVIGSRQPSLFFIPSGPVGTYTVRVLISNANATTVISNEVVLTVVNPRNLLVLEGYTPQNNYDVREVSLDNEASFTLTDTTFGTDYNIVTFYAPENDLDAELEIRSSKGLDKSSYSGGQGGVSRIRLAIKKNEEYTALGVSNNSGLFIYRGANLIAVVGKGGDAGSVGNGGAGGGVDNGGENGSGRNAGTGGTRLSAGQLTLNGVFGSNSSAPTILSGDTKATEPNGGRTISCPKGSYWVGTGIPPCSNIGNVQFHNIDGTLISQSALISRGFKPGYTITSTSGKALSTGGNGGVGATGGSGGSEGGGGGGSGYKDGSYTVLSSSSGGNTSSKSTINFKLFIPPPPTLLSTVTHYYDDVNRRDISLTWQSPIVAVVAVVSGTARYYDIYFTDRPTSSYVGFPVSSFVQSFSTTAGAGGFRPSMAVQSYVRISPTQYRVTFVRDSFVQTFNRQFTISVTY